VYVPTYVLLPVTHDIVLEFIVKNEVDKLGVFGVTVIE
jgi:hypothetical protein